MNVEAYLEGYFSKEAMTQDELILRSKAVGKDTAFGAGAGTIAGALGGNTLRGTLIGAGAGAGEGIGSQAATEIYETLNPDLSKRDAQNAVLSVLAGRLAGAGVGGYLGNSLYDSLEGDEAAKKDKQIANLKKRLRR